MPIWPFNILTDLRDEVKELRSTLNNSWSLKNIAFGEDTTVSTNNALTLSAVYASLNILADTLNLPLNVYKVDGKNKNIVDKSDPYEYQVDYLLSVSPSQLYTPSQWIKAMEFSRNIYGDAFSYIIRRPDGTPTALRFIDPTKVKVRFDGVKNWYTIYGDENLPILTDVPMWDMIHLQGGYGGKSPIDWHRESLSFGKSTQVQGTKFYKEGMTNKVVLSHPGTLSEKAQKNLRDSFEKQMQESSNIVLEEGLKPYMLTITPEQSQFIQAMQFSIADVGRIFNIPPHLLGNSDPTYSNMETSELSFVKHNVRPRIRMYEQEFNWKLLGNSRNFHTKFNINALLRADLKARFESYSIGIANKIYNPNEVRAFEDMNAYEGGDIYENPNTTSYSKETNTE